MPDTPPPRSRADVDPNFESQLRHLAESAKADAEAVKAGGQPKWDMPLLYEWSGELTGWEGRAQPFDRSKANQWFVDAVADNNKSGTVGDLAVTTTQIDYLACMERAFRMRHAMPRNRCLAHAAARRGGHGDPDFGVFAVCGIEYVRRLVKVAKGDRP